MELYQLRYFKILCEKKSFSATALAMHVSPPAITIAVQKIEKEFNIQLYDRESRSFRLTEVGEKFLELTLPVLEAADYLEETIISLNPEASGQLQIGCLRGQNFSLQHMFRFSEYYSNIKISIIEAESRILVDMLRTDKLDCAILSRNSIPSDMDYRTYTMCEWRVSIPKRCGIYSDDTINAELLQDFDVFLPTDNMELEVCVTEYFQNSNTHVRYHKVSSPMPYALNSQIGEKRLCFIAQNTSVNSSTKAYHLDPPLEMEMVLVWKKRKKIPAFLNKFIELSKDKK